MCLEIALVWSVRFAVSAVYIGVFFTYFRYLDGLLHTYLLTYLLTPMLILHSLCVFKGGSQRQR